jgi:hypothetical protein
MSSAHFFPLCHFMPPFAQLLFKRPQLTWFKLMALPVQGWAKAWKHGAAD